MAKAITQSVAEKPLQWLLIAGVLGTGAYFLVKKIAPSKIRKIVEGAETEVSADNPFSYAVFLKQTLNTDAFDDADIVIGIFSSLGSKTKVAQVAEKFFVIYGKDILQYLKKGNKTFDFGTGGLSDEDYNRILTIVNNKPKF